MTLIQICMPDVKRTAAEVIHVMEKILLMRKHKAIRRKIFLVKWRALRIELSATTEYRDFRRAVIDRAKGRCEGRSCSRPGTDVHHRRRVAIAPRLAVRPSNGVYLCRPCHKSQPGHARLAARHATRSRPPDTISASARPSPATRTPAATAARSAHRGA